MFAFDFCFKIERTLTSWWLLFFSLEKGLKSSGYQKKNCVEPSFEYNYLNVYHLWAVLFVELTLCNSILNIKLYWPYIELNVVEHCPCQRNSVVEFAVSTVLWKLLSASCVVDVLLSVDSSCERIIRTGVPPDLRQTERFNGSRIWKTSIATFKWTKCVDFTNFIGKNIYVNLLCVYDFMVCVGQCFMQ